MLEQFRLIVVDDEKPQLEALCTLLQDAGFEVKGFPEPAQALEHLKRQSFDVLLTDLRLPGMDGIELVQRARQLDPDLSAVLMTGHGSIKTAVDAMKLGVLDYILKPFKVSELMPVVNRAIEVRKLKLQNSQLIRDLSSSNSRLLEMNHELDHFAGRVAHDLNSLCHIIQGFAGSLTRRAHSKLDEQEQRYLLRINEASARGGQLVSGLLAFARLGSGELKFNQVVLNEVVEKARAMVESTEGLRQADWSIAKLPDIEGDESLLEQVFVNLFSNALKFSQIRELPTIVVEANVLNDAVEIKVIDNGAGFDPDRADGLFKPFHRLHNAHDFEGHGMGLANVKRIIERHGGQITAVSAPDRGAVFTLTLPIHQHSSSTRQANVVAETPSPDLTRTIDEKIDPQHSELLSACVERLNDIVMITEASPIDAPGPRIIYVNSAFEKVTGYGRNEVIGKSPRLLQGPETDKAELHKIRHALVNKKSVHVELINYGKSGKPHWLEMDIVPVLGSNGEVPFFASIQRDVTERRRAEDKLKRNEALQRIGGRLAKLGAWAIELGPVPRLYWSEEVFDILEITKGQLPNSYDDALRYYHGKWKKMVEAALARCSKEGLPFELEPEMRSSNGRQIWARVVGEAVRNEKGEIIRVQGAFQEITDSKLAVLTLMHMNRLLEAQQRVNDITNSLDKPEKLLQEVCSVFCSLGGLPLAWVCEFGKDLSDLKVTAADGSQQAFVSQIMKTTTLPRDHELVDRLRTGKLHICQNVAEEPQAKMWHKQAIEEGLESFAILPIHAHGKLRASLVLFGAGIHFFTKEVRQLLKTVAKNLSFAFENLLFAEERSRNAERLKLLETCVERLNDIVLITEAEPISGDGPKILYVNDAFVRRTGYTREEAIGQTPRILQGERTQRDALDRIRSALKDWKPVREELINYTKSGEMFWLELEIVPVADETGWYTHWVAIERDITERKQAEAALKEGSERFRLLASASRDCIWDWNLITDEIWWNEGFEKLFGFDRSKIEPNNDSWINRLHPDDRERAVNSIFAAINSDIENWQEEYRFAHADGHWLDVLDRGYVIRDEQGKGIRMIGGMTDMSHIRQSERRSQAQLTRMNLLNEITRAIGNRHDLDSIYQVVTNSIEHELPADFCLTASYSELEKTITFRSLGNVTEVSANRIGFYLHASIPAKGVHLDRALQGEFVYQPNLGGSMCLTGEGMHELAGLDSMVIAPLMHESKVLGIITTARKGLDAFSPDELEFLRQLAEHVGLVLAQTELLRELQEAYQNLQRTQQLVLQQERLRALAEMAGGIAHDINNAISPVALYTDALLGSETNLSERGIKQLKTIQLAIDDVARTVDRMGQFSRRREEGTELTRVNLVTVCEQAMELTRARWHDIPLRNGISIDFNVEHDSNVPQIDAAESELREALINLIFNAVDAMPNGGTITLATRLEKKNDHDQIVIEIRDTGMGMSEETRRRCLEPFYTTKGERGTGLGLAMVYGIVKRMRGSIEINSVEQQGTSVRILLPSACRQKQAVALEEPADKPSNAYHLLLIDDDSKVLNALRDGLTACGHRVQVADSGSAGLELFSKAMNDGTPFDAVITDLGMPGMDGRQVAEALKTINKQCPVTLLTGWGKQLDAQTTVIPHIDAVLAKPPKISEIQALLRTQIQ
ncbi:MAG: PAS domain S-box protein [Gammaproteobacteria bacterium]|nr:PAS domain S-box protein [Gammaproteobacteria bacterium]